MSSGNDNEHVEDSSPDLRAEALKQLAQAFPSAFSGDGELDWERLQLEVGNEVPDASERYTFKWAGKRDSVRIIQASSRAVLAPVEQASVNWESTSHVFIEGENLEVLKLLYKAYFGRIRLIYLDPPYNTGTDRIYADNYADPLVSYLALTGQTDENGNLLTTNPETTGRFHSSWLSMVYPRISLARQLLREDGFIVVSIDDAELHHLRLVLNEAFGEENYVATLVWDRNRKNDAKFFSVGHEYMVVYARNLQYLRESGVILRAPKEGVDEVQELWDGLRQEHGDDFEKIQSELRKFYDAIPPDDERKPLARFRKVDGRGPYRDDVDISWPGGGGPTYEVLHPVTGKPTKLPRRGWVYPTKKRMDEEIAKDNVSFGKDETTVPALKSYLFEKAVQVMRSVNFSYAQTAAQEFDKIFDGARVFDNPKHYEDMRQLVDYLTDEEDIVLDFFAGSGSTGHGVLESNHKNGSRRTFILVQLPEAVDAKSRSGKAALKLKLATIADIAMERLRRVIPRLAENTNDTAENEVPEDLGVRVFRLEKSNFSPWPADGPEDVADYDTHIPLFLDRLREGWTPEGVVWEITLREGLPLSSSVDVLSVGENTVHRVVDRTRDQRIHVCLDESVPASAPRALGLGPDDLFVCRDCALTDEVAANLALECRLKTV